MSELANESVDLVVTSPPYPMIEMWDSVMGAQNPSIVDALSEGKPRIAFELMHAELDKVWKECWRVMKDGAFLCINIGDATRTINGEFALYNNNTRIISSCEQIGFINLPNILWKKATNSPNKFMGSGMLPCGAYITLEHEWILIFRKGAKRQYTTAEEKQARRESSFFWEERNIWFSDIWELTGVKQQIDKSPTRERNASYPLELPYRLINMFSQRGDVVLDPFLGLGTTILAAILCERQSIGYEIDPLLSKILNEIISNYDVDKANQLIYNRYQRHLKFVSEREASQKEVKYFNHKLCCKVMTAQETDLHIHYLRDVRRATAAEPALCFEASYFTNAPLSEIPFVGANSLFAN